jgi:hypothetical protein
MRQEKERTSHAPTLPAPSSPSREQKGLYDNIMSVVSESFNSFVTMRGDVLCSDFLNERDSIR